MDLRAGILKPEDIDMSDLAVSSFRKTCYQIIKYYEMPNFFKQDSNREEFLLELSVFLLELECPYDELTSGDIATRFETHQSRELLANFLNSELEASYIYFIRRENQRNDESDKGDLKLTPVIASALNAVKIQKSAQTSSEMKILDLLRNKVSDRISQSKRHPLLNSSLHGIEKDIIMLCDKFAKDFQNRSLLLSSRLKVTVESFLWCDRIKTQESKIRAMLRNQLHEIKMIPSNCDMAHLLAASSSLLYIEKASAEGRRKNTKCKKHPLAQGEAPKDRGGRTNEMTKVRNETYAQQNAQHQGRGGGNWRGGRGGGHRGGHRGGNRGGYNQGGHWQDQRQSYEDNIRQQHMRGGNRY